MRTPLGCGLSGKLPSSPLDIFGAANVKQWCRADQGVTLVSSNASAWNDLSGNGYHYTQATSGFRPTNPVDVALGGRLSMLFDGTDDTMASSLILPRASVTNVTIFAVIKILTLPSIKVFLNSNTPTDDPTQEKYLQFYPFFPVTDPPAVSVGNGSDQVFVPGIPLGTWIRIAVTFSGGTAIDAIRIGSYQAVSAAGDNPANGIGRKICGYTGAEPNVAVWELTYVYGPMTFAKLDAYDSYVARTTDGLVQL